METFLTDFKGREYKLPILTDWEFSYGSGNPTDAFTLTFLYDRSMRGMLSDACRFHAKHKGETVFTGVVDEYEITVDADKGSTVTVCGRGLAALLMDNQAEQVQYFYAGLSMILERHVYPFGIRNLRTKDMSSAPLFNIASGSSQWRVLEEFVWFQGGVRPRFTRDGVLLLNGESGNRLRLSADAAITRENLRERRYGLISEVLVKNRAWGLTETVVNEEFRARGGLSRRVINVPRYTAHDAMRHTGLYQIERSREDSSVYEIQLPNLFSAFPGDIIILERSPAGFSGEFEVLRSRCWADGDGSGTELELAPKPINSKK